MQHLLPLAEATGGKWWHMMGISEAAVGQAGIISAFLKGLYGWFTAMEGIRDLLPTAVDAQSIWR